MEIIIQFVLVLYGFYGLIFCCVMYSNSSWRINPTCCCEKEEDEEQVELI